jgi:hypothetical protein
MSEDPAEYTPQEPNTIDIEKERDVQYWSRRLGVTPEKLTAVVRAVGSSADTVRANLQAGSKENVSEPLTQSGDQRIAAEE